MKKITLLLLLLTPFIVFAQDPGMESDQSMSMDTQAQVGSGSSDNEMNPMKGGPRNHHKRRGENRPFHPPIFPSTISVVGNSFVNIEPDIAFVNIGALKEEASALEAQQAVNKVMSDIQSVLSSMNIDKKDIQTAEYSIRGKYEFKDGVSSLKGYEAKQSLRVMVPIASLNDLLDKVAQADSNIVSDIKFDIKDKDQIYQQAMTQAIDNAREKASKIAEQLGVKLGMVKEVKEMPGMMPMPMPRNRNMMMAAEAPMQGSMISPGRVGKKASVHVRFEIIPPKPPKKEDK